MSIRNFMFQLISEMHRISDACGYVPVITETAGLVAIGGGIGALGFGGILKVHEYYSGQKTTIPYISDDAAQFNVEVGKTALMYGFKRLVPTAGTLLATYLLFDKYEKCEFPMIFSVAELQQSQVCTCKFFKYTCLS
jgi:hypothetical protein